MENAQPAPATARARKRKDLVSARVIVEFPYLPYYRDVGQLALALEREVRHLKDFVRDHRSRDALSLEVEREYRDVCSACGREWDPVIDESTTPYCGNCGILVEIA